MQRRVRPEFLVSEAKDPSDNSQNERAKRLALFLSTVREQPDVYQSFIGKYAQVEDLLSQSIHPDVMQYGTTPDDRDSHTYAIRAIYATSEVLRHGDDLEADTDSETAEAMRTALANERRKNPEADARLIRLGALAGQISVYETFGPASAEGTWHGTESGGDGVVYQRRFDQADIA